MRLRPECFSTTDAKLICDTGIKKCKGKNADEDCKAHHECPIGYFCDGKCKKQVGKGKECKTLYHCQNDLLCHNKECKAYGSLAHGQSVTKDSVGGEEINKEFLCEYGYIDAKTNMCAALQYANATAADKEGLVKCTFGEKCQYMDAATNKTSYERDCECGYNDKGDSYCPLSHTTKDASTFKTVISMRGDNFDNSCHTLRRFDCPSTAPKTFEKFNTLKKKTILAHKFYGAVGCAEAVLVGSYIQHSIAVIIIALAFIF